MKQKIVAISGGFDPLHIGHIKYLKDASKLGKVLVILNTDEWLRKKGNGHPFYPSYEEREAILTSIKYVWRVVPQIDDDMTVCKSLVHYKNKIGIDIFAKGGDRLQENTPEYETCIDNDIDFISGVGGTDKPQSSSWLIKGIKNGNT